MGTLYDDLRGTLDWNTQNNLVPTLYTSMLGDQYKQIHLGVQPNVRSSNEQFPDE